MLELPLQQRNTVEAIGECPFVQEQFRTGSRGAIPAKRAQRHVEELGHSRLVRCPCISDKTRWSLQSSAGSRGGRSISRCRRAATVAGGSSMASTVSGRLAGK